jgi:hypothetical protein
MDQIQTITLGGPEVDVFAPNPDDYEQHTLIGNCIRGSVGDVVQVHKNDLAILRANKLIADAEQAEPEAEPKPTKGKPSQPKAEADLPAIPNLADMPGA